MITKDTLREYHSKPGISKTKLWRIIEKSPQWFKYCADNPPEFNSPALMFGAALHKAVLEPDGFGDEYIVAPKFDRRTKDGKGGIRGIRNVACRSNLRYRRTTWWLSVKWSRLFGDTNTRIFLPKVKSKCLTTGRMN